MQIRKFDPDRDTKAIQRLWRGIGWLEEGQEDDIARFLQASRALVADVDGEAECFVSTAPGDFDYLGRQLPFSAVTAVTTSRRVRRQGLAKRVLAEAIQADASDGALVCGLGMFEQGFYDQLGFGTGSYEHWVSFDPAHLKVDNPGRLACRVGKEDWERVHASRLTRTRVHGSCSVLEPELTRVEMATSKNGFGFGFCDGEEGELTHHFWSVCSGDVEHGPYYLGWMAYRDWQQFLELMSIIRSMGDQIRVFKMREPPGIQLQDLLGTPFRRRHISEKAKYETRADAVAYWQIRICDLPGCMARTRLQGSDVRFNLTLHDPIERYLAEDAGWGGVGGRYVVTLGASSGAEEGSDDTLPVLRASVGAFTRLWLGVRQATSLSVTDDLSGPPELLRELDEVLLCMPDPKLDWDI